MNLRHSSIADLLGGLESRRFTSVDLVKTYIARIQQVNHKVHAVSEISSEAIDVAAERDAQRASGHILGLLHGIPLLVKDAFLTKDDLQSTVGCSGLVGAMPQYEASTIQKLREHGAILLGKTSLTQWANYRSPDQPMGGWSAVGGQCVGAFHINQYPSGSSSGSAVATALGLASASLGTETCGSIINPSSRAGVVGLKPTPGLTSRHGVYPVCKLQDTVGVIAQNVHDAATVLTVIAGTDPQDSGTISDHGEGDRTRRPKKSMDFRKACTKTGLQGVRIAVPRRILTSDTAKLAKFNEALPILRGLGATIIDNAHFSEWTPPGYTDRDVEEWLLAFRLEYRENMKSFLGTYATNPNDLHTLKDVMEYTENTPCEEYTRWRMSEWIEVEAAAGKYGKDSKEYKRSCHRRSRTAGQILELLDRYDCDLLLVSGATNTSADIAGCPAISVPMSSFPKDSPIKRTENGMVSKGPNIPFGLLFVSRRYDDFRLISAAYAWEQATHAREFIEPVVAPDIELPTKK
ncbi:MAG: hypothetical protein MMC33_009550 [Icmadophila ericetorum]|nr:hypothetical protein [Icmadophila ericetorum]